MSVRKRKWTTAKGEVKEAWISDFVDQNGVRQIKTFTKKKDADAHQAGVSWRISAQARTSSRPSMCSTSAVQLSTQSPSLQ